MTTFQQLFNTAPPHIQSKFDDLAKMRERPDFHPEPSAAIHVQIVTERLLTTDNPNLFMTGFYHDIMKFDTMKINEKTGFPTSPGHDAAVASLIRRDPAVQTHIRLFGADPETVAELCKEHMRIKQLSHMRPAKQEAIRANPIFPLLQAFTLCDNMLVSDLEVLEQLKTVKL